MKPDQLAHDFMTDQTGQEGGQVTIDWYDFRNALARALFDAYQRGKDERQAEVDRLNKVIERMQQTMSSQAEQWSRSMAEAKREGMEEAAKVARCAFDDRPRRDSMDWNDGFDDGTKAAEYAIRAKAQEVKT